jgi:hypothetical protein
MLLAVECFYLTVYPVGGKMCLNGCLGFEASEVVVALYDGLCRCRGDHLD